jgi:hypothetical protein
VHGALGDRRPAAAGGVILLSPGGLGPGKPALELGHHQAPGSGQVDLLLLDIFSRYVVGWSLGRHESAALAKTLYKRTQEGESRRVDVEMGCKVGCGV